MLGDDGLDAGDLVAGAGFDEMLENGSNVLSSFEDWTTTGDGLTAVLANGSNAPLADGCGVPLKEEFVAGEAAAKGSNTLLADG